MMKTSDAGREFIESFEGLFLKTYGDQGGMSGVLTIGYGHTTAAGPPTVNRGDVITNAKADQILSTDLGRVELDVSKLIKAQLSQSQFDALVSFQFNTGALGKGSICAKINAGLNTAAMDTLLQYNHAAGKVMAGLTRRRNGERMMFEGNVIGALALAGVHAKIGDPMPQRVDPPAPTTPVTAPAPAATPAPTTPVTWPPRVPPVVQPPTTMTPEPAPIPPPPTPDTSMWAVIAAFITSIFKRKC